MNTVTTGFHTVVGKMTEMSQQKRHKCKCAKKKLRCQVYMFIS